MTLLVSLWGHVERVEEYVCLHNRIPSFPGTHLLIMRMIYNSWYKYHSFFYPLVVLRKFWGVEDISFWGMEGIIFCGGSGNFKQTQDNKLLKTNTCLQCFSSMNTPYKWTLTVHMLMSTWAAWNMHLSHRFNICLTTLTFNPTLGPVCSVPLSCTALCDPMDLTRQVPLSLEFSRYEYCSVLPFTSPEYLPDPGIKPASHLLHWYVGSYN